MLSYNLSYSIKNFASSCKHNQFYTSDFLTLPPQAIHVKLYQIKKSRQYWIWELNIHVILYLIHNYFWRNITLKILFFSPPLQITLFHPWTLYVDNMILTYWAWATHATVAKSETFFIQKQISLALEGNLLKVTMLFC